MFPRFTDCNNGSSTSSHPTPLESSLSSFSNNAGQSIQPTTPASAASLFSQNWDLGPTTIFPPSRPTSSSSFRGTSRLQRSQGRRGDVARAPSPYGPFGQKPPSADGFWSTPPPSHQSSPFGGSMFSPAFGSSLSEGAQTTTPSTFVSPGDFLKMCNQQCGGSKVVAYAPTTMTETDYPGAQSCAKYESISAMPVYKEKSHEELRWEDYQLGGKGNCSFRGFEVPFESSKPTILGSPSPPTSLFGSPSPPCSLFPAPSPNLLPGSASLFGSLSPSTSLFGSPNPPTSIFGSHSPPTTGLFSHCSGSRITNNIPKKEATHPLSSQDGNKMDYAQEIKNMFQEAELELAVRRHEGKQLDAWCSTLFPEPHDDENDKRLDKKKVQDLRKALQEELRASVRHIAFLTSMLGKLDGLFI